MVVCSLLRFSNALVASFKNVFALFSILRPNSLLSLDSFIISLMRLRLKAAGELAFLKFKVEANRT